MIYKIYNFEIEEDRVGYILREFGIMKSIKDGKEVERFGLRDTVFPATIENCFKKILHYYKKDKEITLSIEEYLKEIKKINEEFLTELKIVLGNKED